MTTRVASHCRRGAGLAAFTVAAAIALMIGNIANAAIVPTVPLGTSASFSVLGGQTVTNTGNSTLNAGLGVWPGSAVTGFPPGRAATIHRGDAVAKQAQSDLTAAYLNAAGRAFTATTSSDLANKRLGAGVYSGPSKSALSLTGPLILDGAGNPSSVFIFQTNSTLITGSGSTVTLVNGAQECNVFWQVGSSATLGSTSVFRGNILALSSISLNNGVVVHGRALARNASVTLINDTFTAPTCATTTPVTTTTVAGGSGTTVPGVVGPPRTGAAPLREGSFPWRGVLFLSMLGGAGIAGAVLVRRGQADSRSS